MVIAYTVAGAAAVVLGLAGLLRLCKTVGERLARADDIAPAAVRPPVAPGRGFLSADEETLQRWAAEATRRDLARLAAVDKVFTHGMNRLFERALAQLLPGDQTARNVARADLYRYPLVGAQ